jgi:hypothetical protein
MSGKRTLGLFLTLFGGCLLALLIWSLESVATLMVVHAVLLLAGVGLVFVGVLLQDDANADSQRVRRERR